MPFRHSVGRQSLPQHDSNGHELKHLTGVSVHESGSSPPLISAGQGNMHPDRSHTNSPRHQSVFAVLNPWRWEFVSILLSWIFLIAIAILLREFNGHPVQAWQHGITLNAVVSLLGTFATTFLLLPISEALGQVKWTRLTRTKRRINEFQVLDNASRGPTGSLLMLLSGHGGLAAAICAIITLLALASATFLQQVIGTVTVDSVINDVSASIPIATILDGKGAFQYAGAFGGSGSIGLDPGTIAAAFNGLYNPLTTTYNISGTCPAGKCSWEPYWNLAICNSCVNLTSQIQKNESQSGDQSVPVNTYTLPANGFGLGPPVPDAPVVKVGGTLYPSGATVPLGPNETFPLKSIAFNRFNGSLLIGLLAMGVAPNTIPPQPASQSWDAFADGYPMAPPVAYECLLQFCLRQSTATYENGTLSEQLLTTYIDTNQTNTTSYSWTEDFLTASNGSTETVNFNVSAASLSSLAGYLKTLVTGTVLFDGYMSSSEANASVPTFFSDGNSQMLPVFQAMNATIDGFPKLMDNIAASLSLSMRQLPYEHSPVLGTAYSSSAHYSVRWGWLAFPFVLSGIGVVVLIMVVVEAHKVAVPGMWKNSQLAVLYHGLIPDKLTEGLGSAKEMERVAKAHEMELRRDDNRDHLAVISGDI